jgi:DNA repair protein RadC
MPIRLKLARSLTREKHDSRSYLFRQMSMYGPGNVGDVELVVSLLSGPRQRRLEIVESLFSEAESVWGVARLSLPELCHHGLSRSEALRLKAGLELGRRAVVEPTPSYAVHEPGDAYRCVAASFAGEERERFVVVVLDIKNRPRHVSTVAEGSVDLCPVDPREVFATALRERGSAVLIAHNHPSGDPNPSKEDLELTERLVEAGAMLGIPVLDHIIVGRVRERTDESYVSLAERGLMPGPDRRRVA